jgi:hypothetical protein
VRAASQLDLPGILPLLLVAGTWEFLLVRVVAFAAATTSETELDALMSVLRTAGTFSQNLAVLLALVLFAEAVVSLVRDSTFGPLTHRVTVSGFATITLVVCAVSTVVPVGFESTLMAHAATVLFSMLLILSLLWHRVSIRLLLGAVLLLAPTLLRFYASCSISVPLLRTASKIPLFAYHAAEVLAVATALVSPFLLAGLRPQDLIKKTNLVSVGLAALPAVALGTAMAGSADQVRSLCRVGVGFEMFIPAESIVYPLSLFCFLLAVATLVLPGIGKPRNHDEQRIGYGLALLFLAGLDGLEGAVLSVGAGASDMPDLIQYLLEGNWSHMTIEQQTLIGPPLRDLYRVALLGLGYVLVARGIHGLASDRVRESSQGEEP